MASIKKIPLLITIVMSVLFFAFINIFQFILHEWIIIGLIILELANAGFLIVSVSLPKLLKNTEDAHVYTSQSHLDLIKMHFKRHLVKIVLFFAVAILLAVLSRSLMNGIFLLLSSMIIYMFILPTRDDEIEVLNYNINFKLFRVLLLMIIFLIHHMMHFAVFTELSTTTLFLQLFSMDLPTAVSLILLIVSLLALLQKWIAVLTSRPTKITENSYIQIAQFDLISSICLIAIGVFIASYTVLDYYPLPLTFQNDDKSKIFNYGELVSESYAYGRFRSLAVRLRCTYNGVLYYSNLVTPPFKITSTADGQFQLHYKKTWQERARLLPKAGVPQAAK